jgi:tripartite-type tricarboxylate transporter receptor subunit TctC
MTWRIIGSALLAVLLASSPNPAPAQELTGRPIRLLVGLAAGGATDVMARLRRR